MTLRLAGLRGRERLVDRDADGVGRLGRRQDALGPGELDAGLEARPLVDAARLDEAVLLEQADQRRHAVVAQAAGVDRLGDEVVSRGCAS